MLRQLKRYKPTGFMAAGSKYNDVNEYERSSYAVQHTCEARRADNAVAFINCLKHTKGEWYGQSFELIDWQEQIVRDVFGVVKPTGYRQFNTASPFENNRRMYQLYKD